MEHKNNEDNIFTLNKRSTYIHVKRPFKMYYR